MSRKRLVVLRCSWIYLFAAFLLLGAMQAAQSEGTDSRLGSERALAATASESRMVETVRTLVGFGTRAYGSPSNHRAAEWLAGAFREAGLEAEVRKDTPRSWYLPASWEVRASSVAAVGEAKPLETAWPLTGSSGKGEGDLALEAAPGAVCLASGRRLTPEAAEGCIAVLYDGRTSKSGWPMLGRMRGKWTIPVFAVSSREIDPLRKRLAAGEKVHVSFSLETQSGNDPGETVLATLPGKDHSKYVLFCAHGDSDSGGPGADDNASGVAIVLEIARAAAAAVKTGAIPQPAWDLRFAAWGGEMISSRQYAAAMEKDSAHLEAVFNYDQAGFGSSKDALYVEPDDLEVNRGLITVVRAVMKDHLGEAGFPEHAASIKSQGGTDSYVFQNTRQPGSTLYPAVTLYTSAWDREEEVKVTDGFPPLNWYSGEKPGMVTVDGDAFYHSVGDTPEHTTDTEPFNMGWCARVGLLSVLRLMK